MLSIFFALLRLLSECAGLYAARYVLVAIWGPHVTGLRLVRFVVAAMDHLLHAVPEFKHQAPESSGHDFRDFLFHFLSPICRASRRRKM
jgi:hypothetical protein